MQLLYKEQQNPALLKSKAMGINFITLTKLVIYKLKMQSPRKQFRNVCGTTKIADGIHEQSFRISSNSNMSDLFS